MRRFLYGLVDGKQQGLSQEALAQKVTVTRQTISKWELNQSEPDLDFIAQLSEIFQVSTDYLIKDELTTPGELPAKKTIPLLFFLSMLLQKPVVFTLGSCISLICIADAWVIYRIFLQFHSHSWRACGFSLLVLIPVPIVITHLCARFLPPNSVDFRSDIFNSSITLLLSLVCFGVDYLQSR